MQKLLYLGDVVPKSRPKVGYGHGYLPKRYVDNQLGLIQYFQAHLKSVTEYPVSIHLEFHRQNAKSDTDNLAGAVLDALVKAQIVLDDRGRYICASCARVLPPHKKLPKGFCLTIKDNPLTLENSLFYNLLIHTQGEFTNVR